jgi:glycosyl transferase family 87
MSNDLGRTTPSSGVGLNDLTIGVFGAAVLLFGAVLWSANGPHVEKTDFSLTYVGAKIVHNGMGSRLYDIGLQKQVRDATFLHPSPLLFEHPPFEAVLLSPLAALPFRTAYLIWGLLNGSIWLAFMFVLRPYLPSPREDLGYVILWLLFAPLGVALYQGQSSLIVLALYAASLVLLMHSHEFAAGVILGLGLFKFQFILPFALIFLFRKRWRYVLGVAASGVCLTVLSVSVIGWRSIVQYLRFVLVIGKNPQNLSYGSAVDMPTIHGFVYAVIGRVVSPMMLNVIVAGVSIFLLAWIAWNWPDGDPANPSMYAAAISACLLAGSHMFTHDFSPLILSLFIAAATVHMFSKRGWRAVMFSTLIVFWLPPVYFILVGTHLLYLMCPLLTLFTLSLAVSAEVSGWKCIAGTGHIWVNQL